MLTLIERIKYAWQPKSYALHLGCRECSHRLDTKSITESEALDWIHSWKEVHNHD